MKHRAFTLAEVLITLGIIGVVAAMTLPTVIQNYQKKRTVEQLKVAVSTMEQGFKMMLATEGVETLDETEFFRNFKDNNGRMGYPYESPEAVEVFKKYFKGVKIYETSAQINNLKKYYNKELYYGGSPWFWPLFEFPKGFGVNMHYLSRTAKESPVGCEAVKAAGGSYCKTMNDGWHAFTIDVNANQLPNRNGYDRFYFVLTDKGNVLPTFDKNWSIYSKGEPDEAYYYWENPKGIRCPLTKAELGSRNPVTSLDIYSGCAAKIIEDGWQINYYWRGTRQQ